MNNARLTQLLNFTQRLHHHGAPRYCHHDDWSVKLDYIGSSVTFTHAGVVQRLALGGKTFELDIIPFAVFEHYFNHHGLGLNHSLEITFDGLTGQAAANAFFDLSTAEFNQLFLEESYPADTLTTEMATRLKDALDSGSVAITP